MYLSFDIMGKHRLRHNLDPTANQRTGKVGFGKEFNSVINGEEHPAIEGVHSSMNVLGIVSHVPWLLNMMGKIPGAAAAYQEFFAWCGSEIEAKKKVSREPPNDQGHMHQTNHARRPGTQKTTPRTSCLGSSKP